MTKSTITREQLTEWVAQLDSDGGCDATDKQLETLIRQSLAAMDSEPEYLPLDYLQGHRDGLEWSARLAESNHPQTGDWLYDDPIELAKAIRKGPDMPPAQPVEDSEPDRNPVLAYADSYRDMAKQGVESVPIWSVITDLERNIAPLYRHAQQPVVPDYPETLPCPVLLEPGLRFGKGVKTRLVLDAIQRRAEHSAELEAMTPEERAEYDAGIEEFKAMLPQPAQPAPVVPDEMTPEQAHEIGDYYGDPVDVFARAANWMRQHIIDSTLAAEPQSPGSEPATVPGKWIPVREQMPESKPGSYEYLVFETLNNRVNHDYWNVPDKGDEAFTPFWNYYGEHVTHWQPMPAAPQEVK